MYRRKAYDRLLEWKNTSNGSTAVLVDGARRVGKSTTVAEFAKNEYSNHLIINFENCDPSITKLFNDGIGQDIDRFLMKLQILADVNLARRKSVIIFDEVQFCPRARQAIKHLVADGRFDYIETGSLISIRKNVENILVPSEEETLRMYPMDFEEYLWARGDILSADYIRKCFESRSQVDPAIHRKLMDIFREYMVVGGMPQAVSAYLDTHDIARLESVKKSIIQLYLNDMGKMPTGKIGATRSIFEHIPSFLSRHSQVFSPGAVSNDSRTREYADCFEWLDESRVVNTCTDCTDPGPLMGLSLNPGRRKLYLSDTGLLVTLSVLQSGQHLNDVLRTLMFGKLSANTGMFVENTVAQELASRGYPLTFHEFRDGKAEKLYEVDFLLARGKKIVPVEVKSSKATPHASLDRFNRRYGRIVQESIVLCSRNLEQTEDVTYLPMYMAICL